MGKIGTATIYLGKIGTATIYLMFLLALWCSGALVRSVLAIPAERDNFIILGRSGQDSEGKSVLVEEKIALKAAPNVNSPEQGRLDSGASVLVLDKKQLETETFYLVLKIGEGGGLSGWVSEDYIYEILPGQPAE